VSVALPVSAAQPEMRDVLVEAVVSVMAGDGVATVPNRYVADAAGTPVPIPAALAGGLTRGQPVTVTLAAPASLDDATALAAVAGGDPAVTVTAVTPGAVPALEFADQDGLRTATVLVASDTEGSTTVPTELTSALALWEGYSGGRFTVAATAQAVSFDVTGTCDAAVIANRAVAAAGVPVPTGHDLVVVDVTVDCAWRTYATMGGNYVVLNGRPATLPTAHALGHALGLADVDFGGLMAAGGEGRPTGTDVLNAAYAAALGWLAVVDVPTGSPWTVDLLGQPYFDSGPVHGLVLPDAGRGELFAGVAPPSVQLVDLTLDRGIAQATMVGDVHSGRTLRLDDGTTVSQISYLGTHHLVGVVPSGVDGAAPTAPAVVVPANSWITSSSRRVSWAAATDDVGLLGHTLMIDGEPVRTVPRTATSAPAPEGLAGPHQVTVVATDLVGNTTSSPAVTLTFGTPADVLAIDPFPAQYLFNPVTISWRPGPALTDPVVAYRVSVNGTINRIVPASARSVSVVTYHGGAMIAVEALGTDGEPVARADSMYTGQSAPESLFTDITRWNRFPAQIFWLASAGITTGFSDGTFRPGAPIARDAMAAYLYRFPTMDPRPTGTPASRPFSDVPVGHQFAREIAWLKDAGITTGFQDGRFRGEAPVSREAMAAFLFRFAGSDDMYEPPAESPFTDVAVDDTFYREIAWLAETGITTGYADGTFRPGDPVTREAMAAFLFRLVRLPSAEVRA